MKSAVPNVSITPAGPTELRDIGRLMADVYAQLDGFPSRAEQPFYYRQFDHLEELIATPGTCVLAARAPSRELVGAVVYFDDMQHYGAGGTATRLRDAAGLRLLAVVPQARGQSIGRQLTADCIERARMAGRASLVLHTTRFMPGARRLYETMGFERMPSLDFMQGDLEVLGFRLGLS